MKYAVVFEPGPESCGAFAPDLPGYAAAADSLDELKAIVREGLTSHVEGLRAAGQTVPEPRTFVERIEVS
jgi:predicted RNase H-like HicB family nuclease